MTRLSIQKKWLNKTSNNEPLYMADSMHKTTLQPTIQFFATEMTRLSIEKKCLKKKTSNNEPLHMADNYADLQ